MPRYDRTGPIGAGPGTGRGFGPCGFGRRRGADRGLGRYFPCWDWPETKEDQKNALEDYQKALEEELEDVKKEAEELGKAE